MARWQAFPGGWARGDRFLGFMFLSKENVKMTQKETFWKTGRTLMLVYVLVIYSNIQSWFHFWIPYLQYISNRKCRCDKATIGMERHYCQTKRKKTKHACLPGIVFKRAI